METKHTKGNWEITGYAGEHDESGASIKCNGEFICSTTRVIGNNWDEYYANAKLIKTAPVLLKACIEAVKHHQGGHSEIGHILKEAIKEATE